MKYILTLIIFFLSSSATAESIVDEWQTLNSHYLEYVANEKYEEALDAALKLNSIDPSDTQSMLYIVFASIKAGKTPPTWIMSMPWPKAKSKDTFNRQLADLIASIVNKKSTVDVTDTQHN